MQSLRRLCGIRVWQELGSIYRRSVQPPERVGAHRHSALGNELGKSLTSSMTSHRSRHVLDRAAMDAGSAFPLSTRIWCKTWHCQFCAEVDGAGRTSVGRVRSGEPADDTPCTPTLDGLVAGSSLGCSAVLCIFAELVAGVSLRVLCDKGDVIWRRRRRQHRSSPVVVVGGGRCACDTIWA